MKKLLFAMFAFALCLGMISCKEEANKGKEGDNKEVKDEKAEAAAAVSLTDLVAKAKEEGASWSVDEWKAQIKNFFTAAKPMVEEIKALQTEAENAGEDVSKAAEVAGKMAELLKKYEGDMASMEEFGNIMEENETAQKIMEDNRLSIINLWRRLIKSARKLNLLRLRGFFLIKVARPKILINVCLKIRI